MTGAPSGKIDFVASQRPSLVSGDYIFSVAQQVQIDGTQFAWGSDKWTAAPRSRLQVSVAGPRFSLAPSDIQSQFPPPKSLGAYYNVLPQVIFNRTTLPWERTIDNSSPSENATPVPWLALVLFDSVADGAAPVVTNLTVNDLLNTYRQSATPTHAPEFVKMLARDDSFRPGPGELKLETGQHLNDRLTVIDVPRKLLWQILPSEKDIALLAHVREGQSPNNPSIVVQYPVIFCNRLSSAGKIGIGSQSTVHLISLEGRKPLLDALARKPADDGLVRLISLASWSFSTMLQTRTFSHWVKGAWCPDASRQDPNDLTKPSTCSNGVIHTLRLPASASVSSERFLSQGYVPIRHQTRQGNQLVSWYRSPLLPGPGPQANLELPVQTSDQLVRYFSDVAMFDVTYAAAWELGRALTLRSTKVAVELYNWKRAHALQSRQAEEAIAHLPFSPDYSALPDLPPELKSWFSELLALQHVPFHYLVPRQEMLPVESLRFFFIDREWLECLLDGAFSIGRVSSSNLRQDLAHTDSGQFPGAGVYSGFLLRSVVVSGWLNLGVEGYTQAVSPAEAGNYTIPAPPAPLLRMERLAPDILLCLFEGDVQTVDIHEHPDAIHFGVDTDDPGNMESYFKELRKLDGSESGVKTPLPWKNRLSNARAIDMADLASQENAINSAQFAVAMIEGVEKVRLLRQTPQHSQHRPEGV
jgi:hypothetical protein